MAPQETIYQPAVEAYLTLTARATQALPFEMTPLGYPKIPGRTWDPVIGSGPFTLGAIPRDIPLADGVKALMTILAEHRTDGFTVNDLHLYMGFTKDGKLEPSNYTGRKLLKRGHTILDSNGDLLTIHGQLMRGCGYEDQRRPRGETTERNCMIPRGGSTLGRIRRWFSRMYYGLNTDDIAKAQRYAHAWVKHLDPSKANHEDAVAEYNSVVLNEACFRIEDGSASYQENLFVEHAIGEGSGAEDSLDLESSSDDDFDFGSDFGRKFSPDSNSHATKSRNIGAMFNSAMTISVAAAEEREAKRIREAERERTVNYDAMIRGMWRAGMEFIIVTLRQISSAGQSIRSKGQRAAYFGNLEAELIETLRYVKRRLGLTDADARGMGAPTIIVRGAPFLIEIPADEDAQQSEMRGMWKGGVSTLNAQLKHLSVTGQQFKLKVQRTEKFEELESEILRALHQMKIKLYISS
ncbi:hypothetical protein VF21_01963 [Pseudogymnoascus sp. 05NY08]|nr:hypothetical protein VF21_01963 [Pseudogymnoascus sp. 05NY08]